MGKKKSALSDNGFLRYALKGVNESGRSDGATAMDLMNAGLAIYKSAGEGQGLKLTETGLALLAAKKPADALAAAA